MKIIGPFRHRIPILAALLILATTLILFYVSGYYAVRMFEESKERDLGERLLSIGKTVSSGLQSDQIEFLKSIKGDDGFDEQQLKALSRQLLTDQEFATFFFLAVIKEENNLESLMLIDHNLLVLMDTNQQFRPGQKFAGLAIDKEEIDQAALGESATSSLSRNRKNPFKRAYVAIKDHTGELLCVLRLEASRDYSKEVALMQHLIYRNTLFVSALLVLIAFILYRLMKSLIKAEEAVAASDRFKSLGTLAGGIAHELRNPLGIIRVTAESLQSEVKNTQELSDMTKDIIEETDRLNTLVNQFLQFAKPGSAASSEGADLIDVLSSLVKWIEKSLEQKKITIALLHNDKQCNVNMDERSVRQVFLNLLLNAKEAIKDSGEIAIAVSQRKNRAIVEVSDSGSGIHPRALKNVFDPFFTTKPAGTGLGLSITRNIIEHFGGKIEIRSEEGKGTTVTVTLPER